MIFDGHTDIFSDVRYKREAGETQVLKNRHLARLQQGGITGGCFVIWADTFNGLDPKDEMNAIIKHMKD
jgi:membrane dipeptidase